MNICKCGCGKEIKKDNQNYFPGHKPEPKEHFCECGCEQLTKNLRFIHGHNASISKGTKKGPPTQKQLEYWERLKTDMSGEGNHFYGRKHNRESKEKMSESRTEFLSLHPEVIEEYRERAKGKQYHKGYKHSEESKEKMRQASTGNQYAKGMEHTPETKQKISEKSKSWYKEHTNPMKGKKHSKETLVKMSEGIKKFHEQNPNFNKEIVNRPEVKEKLRIANTGKKLSKESTNKRTETRRKNGFFKNTDLAIERRMKSSGHKKFSYISDTCLTIKMRSTWEVKYAKYLDSQNIKWEYEPKQFKLSNGKRYWPDFYLPQFNEWHEVKGYTSKIAKEKLGLFKEEYVDIILKILEKQDLLALGINLDDTSDVEKFEYGKDTII